MATGIIPPICHPECSEGSAFHAPGCGMVMVEGEILRLLLRLGFEGQAAQNDKGVIVTPNQNRWMLFGDNNRFLATETT